MKNFRFSSSCLSYVLYVFAYQKILQWKRQQHLQFCACMLSRSIQPVLFHGGFVLLSRKSLYENYNGYQIEYLFLKQDIVRHMSTTDFIILDSILNVRQTLQSNPNEKSNHS